MVDASDDIDVVIPVYNGATYIEGCIASVFSQTQKPRRIIVVDDGSTDGTAEVVGLLQKEHPALTFLKLERNSGVSAARNAGIALSDAPFIAFVDADDIWLPCKLDLQLQVFKKSQRPIGFVHSSFFLFDEAENALPHQNGLPPLLRGDVFSRLLREGNVLSGSASSVLIKRDILNKAGFFDDQLHYGEDWDLWLRLAAIAEVDHTPKAVVGIRTRRCGVPHRRAAATGYFLQSMRVYSRWEDFIRKDRLLVRRIRRDGFRALLIGTRRLRDMKAFYRTLKGSNQNFSRNLYGGRPDFWFGLLATAVALVCKRITKSMLKVLSADQARENKMRVS